jgi:hypothetical protein
MTIRAGQGELDRFLQHLSTVKAPGKFEVIPGDPNGGWWTMNVLRDLGFTGEGEIRWQICTTSP